MDRRFDSFYHFQQYFDQMVIIKVSVHWEWCLLSDRTSHSAGFEPVRSCGSSLT